VPVFLRRAEHRRNEAARLREELAARGVALAPELAERSSSAPRRGSFI
jgi:hypothetical protein